MNQRDSASLHLLRHALNHGDPVPDRVYADARAAYAHRLPHATALALLTTDTAVDPTPNQRSAPTAPLGSRYLEFHTERPPADSATPVQLLSEEVRDSASGGDRDFAGDGSDVSHLDPFLVRVEVTPVDRRFRLLGHLSSPGFTEVRVVRPSEGWTLEVSPEGTFSVDLAPGPMRLLCFRAAPDPAVATSWTVL